MRIAYLVVAALAALAACSPVVADQLDAAPGTPDAVPGTPDAAPGTPDAPPGAGDFTLEDLPVAFTVPVGGFNLMPVRVNRTGSFTGAVTITLQSLPAGVTAPPITLSATQTTAEVKVSGAAPLAIGNTFMLTVVGTAGSLTHQATVQATATGAPGSIDVTFAPTATNPGVFQTVINSKGGPFHDLFVLPNQRIVAAGEGLGLAVIATGALVTTDGALDTTFNSTGTESFNPCGCSAGAPFEGVARLSNGDFVFVGQGKATNSSPFQIFTMVVKPTGVGDNIWGSVGKDFEALGGTNEVGMGAVVLQGDAIVEAVSRDNQVVLMALAAGGGLLSSFGSGGQVDTGMQGATHASIALDGQQIYVVGTIGIGTNADLQVERFTASGQLDGSFGNGGKISFGQPGVEEDAVAVVVQPDHKVVIVAHARSDFMLVRFTASGAVDSTFGQGGATNLAISDGDDVPVDAKAQPDGRIVVVGNASGGTKPGPIVARYRVDGTLDPTFGSAGVASIFIGSEGAFTSAELQSSDKLVIGGVFSSFPFFSAITRVWL
jgi:uncharacterized delta-60 repeat protein